MFTLPAWVHADEIAELKAKLAAANAKIADLEKELAELKGTDSNKSVVASLGSVWKGKTSDQRGVTASAEWSVIAREDNKITFKSTTEFGNMWEYDGEFLKANPRSFKIVDARRIKAADANTNPKLVGTVVGNGTITGDKLTVRITWNNAQLTHEFKGTLKDSETVKKAVP